jgi:hypothetical protein
VVAIIALLISILLPSLRSAQEQARMVVCGNHMRLFGNGLAVYVNDNEDYLPGCNTSGVALRSLKLMWGSRPDSLYRPDMPVQSFDWMTPIVCGEMELPAIRAERFKFLMSEFRCPSQRYTATFYPGGYADSPDKPELDEEVPFPAVSYLMPVHFQYVGQHQKGTVLGYMKQEDVSLLPVRALAAPLSWETCTDDFLPRIDRVGQPSRKIFVADGTRYLDSDSELLDIDPAPEPSWFGSFTTSGGWWSGSTAYGVSGDSTNWDGAGVDRGSPGGGKNLALSYRHGAFDGVSDTFSGDAHDNKGRIESLFFDGHVQALTDRKSREVHYWYPTGTIVRNPGEGMTNVPRDFVIP